MFSVQMKDGTFRDWTERYWTSIFAKTQNPWIRTAVAFLLSLTGFGLTYLLDVSTGHFFTSITMVTVILISINSGGLLGFAFGITMTLAEDACFIAPVGSIFDSNESVERFVVIGVLTVIISFLGSSIRIGFSRAVREKEISEHAKKDADVANKHKSEFLSKMSHEIRTPINGIIGMTELLRKTDLNRQQTHYVNNLRTSSNLLLSLINDILDLDRVEAGQLSLEMTTFSLNQIVSEISALYGPLAEQRGIKLTSRLDNHAAALNFKGDQNRIRQVITNFIGNSLKFTSVGQISFQIRVVEPDALGVAQVTFSVTDTGIGISKTNQERLFQNFSQGDSSTARKYGGSGLGLAICKQLVGLMGGSIGLESDEGKGAKFWFTLDLQTTANEDSWRKTEYSTEATENPTRQVLLESRKNTRILLAEDNEINQEITRTMLENAGFSVDSVANGGEVISFLNKHSYALILMDCQMPVIDGYDATKLIRSKGLDIPIIALTAHAYAEDRERCLSAGMSDYLAKPIAENTLIQMVCKYTHSAKSSELLRSGQILQPDEPEDLRHSPSIEYRYIRMLEDLDPGASGGLVHRLIVRYLETAPLALQAIKMAAISADTDRLRREAHKFRSTNGSLGLMKIAGILEQLEYQQGPDTNCFDLVNLLEAEIASAIQELKQYRAAASASYVPNDELSH